MGKVVFLLALMVGSVAFAEGEKVTIRPAGVTLLWEQGDEKSFEHLSVLNSQEPVALALYLSGNEKKIVLIDRDKSKLATFTDDQGTEIEGKIGHFPRIAKDGSAAFVEVRGEKAVSPKAEALLAKGQFKVAVASKTEVKRSKVVSAKKGSKVELAEDLVFEITKTGKPDWGDDPFALTLKIQRDISEVAMFRFYDEEGKQIESRGTGSGRGGFLGKVTVTRDFNLKRKAAKLILEVDRWTDLEKIAVPFDVKVGIGGGR